MNRLHDPPEEQGTTDFSTGIGTGPFKVKEFKPGIRSVMVRNESAWKPGKPYFDEIEFVVIGDKPHASMRCCRAA